MAVMTNLELVEFLRSAADLNNPKLIRDSSGNTYGENHGGFVWGLNYEVYTEELMKRKASTAKPGTDYDAYYYTHTCQKNLGKRCSDCSGLHIGAFRSKKPTYGDTTANGLYSGATEKGKIDTIPEDRAGISVFRYSTAQKKMVHVGSCIGGEDVVEARSTGAGIVCTKLKERGWTHWARLKDVEFIKADPPAPVEEPVGKPFVVRVNNLNFRKGPGTNCSVLQRIHKGDALTYYYTVGKWARVDFKGLHGYVWAAYIVAAQSSTAPPSSFVVYPELTVGSKDRLKNYALQVGDKNGYSYVALLQTLLNRFGYKLAVDGSFGPKTDAALTHYQRSHNLAAKHLVTTETWTDLHM